VSVQTVKERRRQQRDYGYTAKGLVATSLGCAVLEFTVGYGEPPQTLQRFVNSAWRNTPGHFQAGPGWNKKWRPPFVTFATVEERTNKVYGEEGAQTTATPKTGRKFAAFIRANGLGRIIGTPAKYNYQNRVAVYTWTPDWDKIEAYGRERGWIKNPSAAPGVRP
jgi:hypothetical protein